MLKNFNKEGQKLPLFGIGPYMILGMGAVALISSEEKWLSDLYGADYEAYKTKVNRCIPWKPAEDRICVTEISNARWMAYDIPGNVGWIIYIACLYGCSMGGSIVIRMLADNALDIRSAVIDGGITPCSLKKPFQRMNYLPKIYNTLPVCLG